jgi:hypothetical protein
MRVNVGADVAARYACPLISRHLQASVQTVRPVLAIVVDVPLVGVVMAVTTAVTLLAATDY